MFIQRRPTSVRRPMRLVRLLLASALTASCGSAGADGNGTGTIALGVAPAAATVQVGGTVNVTVTLTRGGSFSGAVTYTVEGAPAGVVGTVTAVDSTTGTVLLSASSSAVPGTYHLTVRATATGVSDATTAFSLTVPVPIGSFSMILPAAPTTMAQGTTLQIPIGIQRSLGFPSDVTLSISGVPTGVTAQFSPAVVNSLGSLLAVTVAATVPPATYHLTVRATAPGQTDVTGTLTLIVALPPTFSITAGATAVNVLQGSASQTYLKATRGTGFTGQPAYTVSGAPAGLSALVAPTTVADSVIVTVSASSGLAGGSYPIVVHANATGAAEQTASITVMVATSAGVDVHLDFSACQQSGVVQPAIWVAYQDGAGAWTRVNGAAGIYNFHINGSVGGVAVVRQQVQFYTTSVSYLTQAELQAMVATCVDDPGDALNPFSTGTKTISGTLARLDAGATAQIVLGAGNAGSFGISGPTTTFHLTSVLDGPQDLLALRYNPNADRMVIRRDLNLGNGATLAPIDFDGAEAFAPLVVTMQLSGLTPGGQSASTTLDYLSGTGCTRNRFQNGSPNPDGSIQVAGVPVAQQRSNDFHAFTANDNGNFTGGSRYVRSTAHLLTAQTVAFGPTMPTTATVSTLAGGYPRLTAAFVPPADYSTAGLYFQDGLGHVFIVSASSGYRGQVATQISAPDLSTVAGYATATWAPAAPAVQIRIFGRSSTQRSACSEGITRYADQIVTGP